MRRKMCVWVLVSVLSVGLGTRASLNAQTLTWLGTLPDGIMSSATGVSADGTVVVGWDRGGGVYRAFRWTSATGMQDLGTLPGSTESYAFGVSSDGKVVVGGDWNANNQHLRAFRWTSATGMQDLGTLGGNESEASGVSADGTVVVGMADNASGQARAFRWVLGQGMEDLNTTYASLLNDGSVLWAAHAISPDGRYIVGSGYNARTGRQEAFLLDTCPGGDTDGDCICDDWERNGIDVNRDGVIDLDLPALGALVGQKDLFVEYDSMTDMRSSATALSAVRDAFAHRGIALHFLDGGDQDIPAVSWRNDLPDVWTDFDDVKRRYYGTPTERASGNREHIRRAKRMVVRYCLFAVSYGGGSSSGFAELLGDDCVVTLGHPGWLETRSSPPRGTRWDDIVAGTLMHELGHTLGLRHGGSDHLNYKPNYHSVMNYLWQMPEAGYADSWVLDYSGRVFNTLDEDDLSEPVGIGGHLMHQVPIGGRGGRLVDERGPVDWNGDGDTTDTGVEWDVNGDGSRTVLTGYNDWDNLDFTRGPNWADGVHVDLRGTGADLEEMTFEVWLSLARIGMPSGDVNLDGCVDDADLLAVLFAFGTTESGQLEDLNEDGTVDDADLLIVLFNFGSGC